MKKNLSFYGDIYTKMCLEGEGYYITDYESPSAFEEDTELKEAFISARSGMNKFTDLLEKRIKDLGGNLDDFEA